MAVLVNSKTIKIVARHWQRLQSRCGKVHM